MPLKALDVLVILAIASAPAAAESRTYAELAEAVGLSASETHQAVRRAVSAGLLLPGRTRMEKPRPRVRALIEFLEHGVPHAFFAAPGRVARGIPTAHSASPLREQIQSGDELPLVWPDPKGTVRGRALEPLHRSAPAAALRNPKLYELLALVDALRCGSARERTIASRELRERLEHASDRPHS